MKLFPFLLLVAFIVTVVSCGKKDSADTVTEQPGSGQSGDQNTPYVGPGGVTIPNREPMMVILDRQREKFYQTENPKVIETEELGIDLVRQTGVQESALFIGAKIPMFSLNDTEGNSVSIASLLAKGPVIIMWFRGSWCPYSTLQLSEMQHYMDFIKDQGASLVAISPMLPEQSARMKERLDLTYVVLSDEGNVVADKFRIKYKMPKDYAKYIDKKHSLKKYYGNSSGELPVTMTYVVDQESVIKYAYGEADFRRRAGPHEIMDILMQVNKEKSPH